MDKYSNRVFARKTYPMHFLCRYIQFSSRGRLIYIARKIKIPPDAVLSASGGIFT